MSQYPDWYLEELRKLETENQPAHTNITPVEPTAPAQNEYPPEYLEELKKLEAQESQKELHPTTGRPIIHNPDGSISTERSITITDVRLNGGMPTNIPTIWNGVELDEEDAIQEAIKSGQQFKSYKDIDTAVAAAQERSEQLGKDYEQPLPDDYIAEVRRIEEEHKKDKGLLDYVGEGSKKGLEKQKHRLNTMMDLMQDKEPEPYQLPEMPKRGFNKEYIGTMLGEALEADVIPGIAAMGAGASLGGTLGSFAGPAGAVIGAGAGTMAANTAFGYLSTFADEYNNARLAGKNHKEAFDYAEKQGGIAGGFAMATGVLSRFGGTKILPYLAKQVPAQVAASEAENVAHNIVAKESGVDPERDPLEGWQEAAAFPAATTIAGGVINRALGKEHIRPPEKTVEAIPERLGLPNYEGGGNAPPKPIELPSTGPDGKTQITERVRPNPQTGKLENITTDQDVKGTPIKQADLSKQNATTQQMEAQQVPPNIVHIGNIIRSGAGLPPSIPPTPPGAPPTGGTPNLPMIHPGVNPDLGELHQRIAGRREEPLNDFDRMIRDVSEQARDIYDALGNSGTLVFDRFRPALNMGIALGAQREAQAVGYRMARATDHIQGSVNAAYTFGTPYWDARQQVMRVNTDAPGLLDIIRPRYESQFAAENELYMYAKRVLEQRLHQDFPGDISHLLHITRLMPALNDQLRGWLQQNNIRVGTGGREQNLNIHEVQRIVHHLEETHPEFLHGWNQWQEYNGAINDFLEATGINDPDERDVYDLGNFVSFERNLGILNNNNYYRQDGKRLSRQQIARHMLTGKGKMYQVLDRQGQEFDRFFDRPTAVRAARDIGGRIQEVGIPVRNLYENMLAGTAMKIAKGMKNAAGRQIMREAELLGLATQVPEHVALNRYRDEQMPNIVRVMNRGRPVYYHVDDPQIFNMMEPVLSIPNPPGLVEQALFRSKQLFAWSTMTNPVIAAKVIIKDMMVMGLSGKDIFPTMGEAINAYMQNLPVAFGHEFGRHDERLMQIAAMGNEVSFTRNRPIDILDRMYLEHYRPGETSTMIIRTAREATRFIDRLARSHEAAHRLMKYDAAIANGLSEAEAGFEYMDYLDYQLKGSSPIINHFIRLGPFLQSYSQSLYKVGRDIAHATPPPGGAGRLPPPPPPGGQLPPPNQGPRRPRGFQRAARATLNKTLSVCKWYAAFSIINALMNVGYDEEDDEGEGDFFKFSPHFRDNYTIIDLKKWFGKGAVEQLGVRYIQIPKPWELGQLFGTLPEQAVYWAFGKENLKDQVKFLGRMVKNSFGVDILANPIFKSLYEWNSGQSWYTGRPIVPQGKQNLEPFMQSRPGTSETAQAIGDVINRSPAKIEQTATNLLGGFIMSSLMISDMFLKDYEDPSTKWNEKVFVKTFFGEETLKNSDYINQTWELFKDAERAYLTINALDKLEMDERLKKYESSKDVQFRESNYTSLKKSTDFFKDIDKDIESIRKSKSLNPDEKREKIKLLQRAKNIEAYQAVKSVKANRKANEK